MLVWERPGKVLGGRKVSHYTGGTERGSIVPCSWSLQWVGPIEVAGRKVLEV